MSDPQNYTIGWICALPHERTAAKVMLDEVHDGPAYVSQNDSNSYTLGRIGKHNVVIAVLPHGEYGISSATRVGLDMLHTFINVRIGLMVGIGGAGVSSTNDNDVRLGDIVVSGGWKGACVRQYDFGVDNQDEEFRETGALNKPPSVLMTAVSTLQSDYEIEGHQIEETIQSVLDRFKRLKARYGRPNATLDKLYRANVKHPKDSKEKCEDVCGDDEAKLVKRAPRTEDDDNPKIHYGVIASANRLMKNASIRDKMAEEGVLCFEMEAAGLMNSFPCIVIRGICDYSDTHKNHDWQEYAALAAAVYTRDLLKIIVPSRVEAERSITEIIKDG